MYNRQSLPAIYSAPSVTKELCMVVSKIGDIQTSKKNQRQYRQVFVIDRQPEGILTNPKEYSRLIWGELKNAEGVIEQKADTLFNNPGLKVGASINTGHVTFNTTDYKIGTRTVNTITVVAFSHEDPLAIANAQLNRKDDKGTPQGAYVLNLDGEPCPIPTWKRLQMEAEEANMVDQAPSNLTAEETAEIEAGLQDKQ